MATTPEEFIDSAFPYIAGEGGMPSLPAGTQTSPDQPGQRFLKVPASGGGTAHLFATGPFAFAEGGTVKSVNTDLVAVGGGWQPASVPFDVVIPSDLADGIVWRDAATGESVRIYPQSINNAPGRLYAGSSDTIIYDDVWNRTYMTVAVTTHGVKDHIILTQANGVPNQFKFRVERPAGATTSVTSEGAVQVVAAGGAVLAKLPPPVARDRDLQEFAIWYEVQNHAGFDVITLKYDTSPITAEGTTVTFEAPFDLDPTIYSGSLVHGENAFRETSQNAYTVSDFNDGNLKASLLKTASYDAGKFARWWITPPPAGSRWYSFSARAEGRVGQGQHYTLKDDAGTRYESGPAGAPGTYFAQDVSFTPVGDINSRIEATQTITPQYDYYGQLTNPVVVYEDLVNPVLTDLRPNGSTVSASQVTLHVGMSDAQSGCGSISVTLSGPASPIGTRTGAGCSMAPTFDLRTEGAHRIDVTLIDRSGRTTTASGSFNFDSPVDPPLPPVVDGLDFENDQAWTNDATTFSASWNAAALAVSYQLCFTASAPCAPDDRWTGFGASTSGTVGGYAFGHGQTVYACVRSVSSDGVRTTPRCSNGQRVDTQAPVAPSAVRDGSVPGIDFDESMASSMVEANWDGGFDESSNVVEFDACASKIGEACDEEAWFSTEDGEFRVLSYGLQMPVNADLRACIRTRDPAGNVSNATCSDGFNVGLHPEEVQYAVGFRDHYGLNSNPDDVAEMATEYGNDLESDWASGVPVEPSEKTRFMDALRWETWTMDNYTTLDSVYDKTGISFSVDASANAVVVDIAKTACSPRSEIKKAFWALRPSDLRDLRQRPYVPMSTKRARTIARRLITRSGLPIRTIKIARAGTDMRCLENMRSWLNRTGVQRRLLVRGNYRYEDAVLNDASTGILVRSNSRLLLYPGHSRKARAKQLVRHAEAESATVTSEPAVPATPCNRNWGINRNTFYCKTSALIPGSLIHTNEFPNAPDSVGFYGGCTAAFPVMRNGIPYLVTALHCAQLRNGNVTRHARTSFHGFYFPSERYLVSPSGGYVDSSYEDATALRLDGNVRYTGHVYRMPSIWAPKVARQYAVYRSAGAAGYGPAFRGKLVFSSRPSSEIYTRGVRGGFSWNGVTYGTYLHSYQQKLRDKWGQPIFPDGVSSTRTAVLVRGLSSCGGDSGSPNYVLVARGNRWYYQPFGVTSTTLNSMYWEPQYRYSKRLYGEPNRDVPRCGTDTTVAPVADYLRRGGFALQ